MDNDLEAMEVYLIRKGDELIESAKTADAERMVRLKSQASLLGLVLYWVRERMADR